LPAHRFLQLARALATSPDLETLLLNDNHLDCMASDVLSEALSILGASPKLTRLVLYDNYLRTNPGIDKLLRVTGLV
jgi:hypothetical protein